MTLETATGGAFTDPMKVRQVLREVYWEGKRPTLTTEDGEDGERELAPDTMDSLKAMADEMAAARRSMAQAPDPSLGELGSE